MKISSVATMLAAAAFVTVAHAQSDDCSTPEPIAGGGAYVFDLDGFGLSPSIPTYCIIGGAVVRDGWYC